MSKLEEQIKELETKIEDFYINHSPSTYVCVADVRDEFNEALGTINQLKERIDELEEIAAIDDCDGWDFPRIARIDVAKKALDIINQLKEQLSKEIKAHADCKNWKYHLEEEKRVRN